MREVLVIGCGSHFENDWIPILRQNTQAKVTALVEPNEKHLLRAQDAFPDASIYKDLGDLAARSFDLAIVLVPHDQQRDATLFALQRSACVAKSKPLARNLSEAELLTKEAARLGVPLHVFLPRRFSASHRDVKALIKDTQPSEVRLRYSVAPRAPNAGWRAFRRSAGGGVLLDMGFHILDAFATEIAGASVEQCVLGVTAGAPYEVEDSAWLYLRSPDRRWNIHLSCLGPKSENVELSSRSASGDLTMGRSFGLEFDTIQCGQSFLAGLLSGSLDPGTGDTLLAQRLINDAYSMGEWSA